jgi:hypothetical protein
MAFVNNLLKNFLRQCINDNGIIGPLKDAMYHSTQESFIDALTKVYLYMGFGLLGISFLGYKLLKKSAPPKFSKKTKKQFRDGRLVEKEEFLLQISAANGSFVFLCTKEIKYGAEVLSHNSINKNIIRFR